MTQTSSFPALVNRPSMIEYHQYRFLIMDAPTDSNLPAYIDILKKKHVVCVVRACEVTYRKEPLLAAGMRVMELPFSDGDPPPEHMLQQWLGLVKQEFGEIKATAATGDHKDDKKEQKAVHMTKSVSQSLTSASSSNSLATMHGPGTHTNGGLKKSESANIATLTDHGSSGIIDGDNDRTTNGVPKKTIAVHCVAGLGRAPVLVAVALIEAGMEPFEAIAFIRKRRRGAINARQLKYIESYKAKRKTASTPCLIC